MLPSPGRPKTGALYALRFLIAGGDQRPIIGGMDVVLIGAGGHGRVVLDILRAAEVYRPVGFLDADPQLTGQKVDGLPVLGQLNMLPKLKAQKVKGAIISIGDNHPRRQYFRKISDQGFDMVNAIHPSSHISATARLGRNVVVAAGAVISTEADWATA